MRWLKKALKVMVSFATIVGLSTTMVEQTYATTEPYACGLKTIDLIAGQNYDAGDITIWDDGTNLYFKLVTATGWSFDTLHLDIKDSANLLTNVPGQMPYSQSFNPKATQYTFTIPLASIGLGPEETVYFAFHANLYYSGQDGQRQETGWGNGTPGGGGGWWMYNSYTRCELPPQPVPLNLNINKTVEISPLSSVSAADVFAAVRFTLYNKNTYTAPNGTTYAANSALTTFGVNSSGALVTGGFLVFAGAFYLVETQTHPAYTPSAINIHFSVDKNGVVTYDNPSTTTVNNTLKRTSINIQKYISETTTPLAGVVFGLWAGEGRNGEAIATATSDANGQASFTDLPFGVYTVGELSVPTKFNLDAPDQQVSLQEGGASLQFSNSRITYYGTLKIYKWDNYEMPLDGALFAVYQNIDDETPLRTAISMDGVALFENLPEGTYYYEELSAPAGYTKVNGRTAFTIDEKDEVVEFTVINNRIPRTLTLTLKKFLESHPLFALDPSEVYPSIEFSVYSDEVYIAPNGTQYQPDTLLATFTLHSDGTIDTSGYQTYAGSFYIMETKTHPAYVLNDTKVYFDVNANGEVVYDNPSITTIDNLLRKANIEVYKYQKGTSTPIEGVVFGLFDNPEGIGDPVYTVTSDATGYAVFENIPFGEYLIKELSVPEAYKMDAPAQSVSLGENGASLSFYNTLKFYGTLQLNKVDHRGAAVNGAVFALYANLNDETPFMSATSVNGVAVFENIPEGTYYYEEVSAPDGYTFVKGRTAITIDEPNEVITKTVVNKPVPQALKIMLPKVLEEHPYFLVEPGIVYAAIQFELYSNEEYVAPDGTIYPKDSLLATFNVGVDGMIDTSGYETYPGSFYLVESKTHDAYLLNTDKVFFRVDLFGTVTYDDESITQIDNWLRKGDLYVTKYVKDTDGMPLAGVTFGLWLGEERDGEPLRTAVSDEYGQVLFEDLPIGMYTVGELAVPDLYKMDAPDQNIYVDEDGTRISFYNSARIFGSLRINKVDYLENPLDGAIFAIYDSMDATTPITSAPIVNGYVIFSDLEEGTYYYEELAAPAGYQPISGRTAFTIDEADEWIEVSVVNNPIPQPLTIDLVKQLERHDFFSIPDSEVFAMISFRLYAASDYVAPDGTMYPADALLATFNVDSNGMIDTDDYETYPGEFYLQEYSTHPAYKLNTNKMYFSVDLFGELTYDDPNMTSILNVLKVGDILISKYIKDTDGQPLEGVTFGLWLGDERVGDPVLTARSDEYGQVRFEDLPYGTYTVGELSVPDRFKMDAPDQIVIVNEDCEKASFYDSARIYGSLRINKVDYKENPLDGAVFAIYDSMDATTPLMSAPIVNGYVIFSDLEEGTYYYEELSAPTGYQTLTGRTAFTIDEAEEWIEVTLVNNPIPRPLTITLPKVLETNALFTVPNEDVYSMIRFELYSADAYLAPNGTTYPAESLLATFKMSDDGYLDTTGYETYPGNFYIVESETHPSFILNTTKIYFSVDLMGNVTYADSSVTNIYNGLRKGDLMIHKYISDTDGETLAGAVFGLWMGSTRSGDPVMMGTSDGEGHVVFEDLPVGTYTVGELSAPDGYVVDVNDQTITLGEDGAMLYFYNDVEVLVGELVIYKWNAFEQPLDGAIFGLYSSMDAQTPLATGVSVNGMVRFEELPLGTYYYEELSAPLGHALIPGRFAVTIEEEGQIVEVNAINDVLYCGTRFIDLIAGQHFDAGDITVWDDGEHLYIFVQAAQYWSFDELHLDFANSIGDIENAPGQMPYKQSFDNATQYTFVIPLADLDEELDLDVRFYFSLHAAMNYDGPDGTREETAWGEGEDYGRDWQMVSWYERCVEPPTPTPLTITLPKVLEDHPLFTLTPAQVYEQIEFTLYNVNEYKGVNGTTYPANTALATFGLTSAGYLDTTGYETYAGDFYIMETKTHPAYMLDDSKVYFSVDEDGVVTYQDSSKTQIDNDLYKGNLWIMKYIAGSDNVPLAGATFGLWLGTTRDDTPDATAISDASGKVEFNALPIGTYTVGELSAPEGYLLDDTDQTITLGEAGEVLYFYNTPDMITGTLKIYKWSECDCLLDGAVFGLFDSLDASEPLFTATTINGVAVFENLPEGTYYYQELAAPAGYILNTNRKMIVIDEKDEILEVNVINYKYEYGDLIVHKVDLYHGVIPLHGATFALYNAQDERVDEETTDYNGLLRFENLPYGTYKLVEVVAPHGYVLDATPRMVTIDQDEVSIVIKNRMQETTSGLFIFKVDLHEGKPMPLMGATFTLYDFTGRKVIASNLTTNLLGFVNVPNLPSGHYWIQETKAPEGYELMNVKLPVYVSIHSPYSFIVVPNIRTSAVVELHKYDADTDAPLANVVFDVYKANDRERVVATMTTDLSGYAKSGKLPWGDYVLVERSTPAGYQALEPIDFTIGKTDSKVSLEVYNEQIRGSVSLYKYDAITQEAIAGAIFTLQGEDDMYYSLDGTPSSEPVMLTSDEMGEIRVTNLLAGTYRFVEVANEGYEVDATPQVVELAFPLEMNTVVAVNGGEGFANTPEKARVVIHNVNEQDLPINGGKFQIWTSVNGAPGELIEEVETLVEGTKESMWLPYGDYFYLQVRTPQGYILSNPAPVPFTLSLETVDDARELHVYVVNRAQRTYLLSDLKFANVFEIQDRFPDAFQNTSFSIYTSEDISYVNEEGPQFVAKGTKYTFNLKQSGEQTFVLDYGNFTRYMYPGFYYMVQEEVDINYQKFNEVYPFEVVEGIDVIWGNTNARSEETDGTLLLYHKVKRFDINVFYMMEGGGRALPSGRFALLDSNKQPIDELFTGYYDPENFFEDIKALFVFNATQKARMLVTSNKSMEWTALTLGNNANALKDASLFDQEVGPLGVEKSAQDFAAVSIAQEDPAANPLILATDANGELIFPDLPNGTYYVQKVGSPTLYKAVIFNQDVDITVYEREGGDDDVPTFANDYLDLFMATGVLSLLGILVLGRRRKEREEE